VLLHPLYAVDSSPMSAPGSPSSPYGAGSSNLATAAAILERNGFPLSDLPRKTDDPLWSEMKAEYGLTLGQISALKNYVTSLGSTESSMIDEDFSASPAGHLQDCLENVADVSVERALLGPGPCLLALLSESSSRDLLERMVAFHRRFLNDLVSKPGIDLEFLLAIRLYTVQDPIRLYHLVNGVLNSSTRELLPNVAPFVRLLIRGLYALGAAGYSVEGQAYRGLKVASNPTLERKFNDHKTFFGVNKLITLAGFTSVSLDDSVVESFGDSIFFHFLNVRGVDVSSISAFPAEREILVVPPGVFRITANFMLSGKLTVCLTQAAQRDASYLRGIVPASIAAESTPVPPTKPTTEPNPMTSEPLVAPTANPTAAVATTCPADSIPVSWTMLFYCAFSG
jgi:hypothetical protein